MAQNHSLRSLRHGDFLRGALPGDFHRKELLHDVLFNPMDHLFEHFEALFLIFLKRVLLSITPEPDALLQMVHIEEMIFPQAVDGLQHDDLFKLPQHRRAETPFLVFVGLNGPLGKQIRDSISGQAVFLGFEVQSQIKPVKEPFAQSAQIPFRRMKLLVGVTR